MGSEAVKPLGQESCNITVGFCVVSNVMRLGETEFELVQRHVREGEGHVSRQLEIIAAMQILGQPTSVAESLLFNFDKSLRAHKAHLKLLILN